ncbi:hypothetical protein SKAU_G00415740 [Synaphobranchus kaupii]|uniref:ribonuclease H n=1 Tax=Synaphobranchus kaupii TaxID=118154 RepID=A0A9Q1E7C4_SYNKA|nr:hypothetical protein SKAU_G00415740 [Synaphobranchus kaupii]
MRGNLIYVDDILMRSQTWDAHLAELRHVLNQLSTAGAKLSLTKGQWCQTKVEYVGLLVGANGVEPQSGRVRAIQDIKAPSNGLRLREGRVSKSRIAAWMMALQDYVVEVKYAQYHKMALGQGLAECQYCDSEVQPQEHLTVVTALSWPSNHHFYDDNVCLNLPKAYVDGCSFHHESQVQAGVGITWENCTVNEPQQYQLGSKTSQYAEIASMLITLQQAARSGITELVICSDSNYARYSFVSHFPIWKQNGMKNARGKAVKHSELFLICDKLTSDHGMTTYWKKVKGHSQVPGPDKDGNDEADRLAKAGALDGSPWEFQEEWLPKEQTCIVNAITRRQTCERLDDPGGD